jgi:hypothetical protein
LRTPFAENDVEMVARWFRFLDRVLRDDATIVFDLDLELVVRQNPLAQLQNLGQAVGLQTMIGILADMGLQKDTFVRASNSAAIDEIFRDVSHFCHMGVRRDEIAVRENKARERPGIQFEG